MTKKLTDKQCYKLHDETVRKLESHKDKSKELVKTQTLHDRYGNNNYTRWAGSHQGEVPEAEPDSLVDEGLNVAEVRDVEDEVKAKALAVVKLAKQILTEQQYKVFDLLALQCNSVRRAARRLKLHPSRVDQLWKAARIKLQRAYDERSKH